MKIKKCIFLIVTLLGYFLTGSASATDLLDVYKDALGNDPKFKGAYAHYLSDKESLAISRADLLPQLGAIGSFTRARNDLKYSILESGYTTTYNSTAGYKLQLVQPIFNFKTWANVWGQQALVYKAGATYLAAQEDLLRRTVTAYFTVLNAKDVLASVQAKKAARWNLFKQTKHKFDVGLVAIAELENTRANYEAAVAEEIGAKNDLDIALEKVGEITKVKYKDLVAIKDGFPLLTPQPEVIDSWVQTAEKQNFDLSAARYDVLAARERIKEQAAGHLPTLNASITHGYQYNNKQSVGAGEYSAVHSKNTEATAELSVPLFTGGKVVAATRQTDYQYQERLQVQEQIHREVVSKTRQAYLGILSAISKIRADLKTIKAATSYLRATQASYEVGAKSTLTDVLDAQTKVCDAKQALAKDQYTYFVNFVELKALTGTLGIEDLKQINVWLGTPVQKTVSKKINTPKKNMQKTVYLTKTKAPIKEQGATSKTSDISEASVTSSASDVTSDPQPLAKEDSAVSTKPEQGITNDVSQEPAAAKATSATNKVTVLMAEPVEAAPSGN